MSSPRPVCLRGAGEPVFGFFHPAAADARRRSGVLFCPPFGWDEVCSYRSRRDWAQDLAQAGFPALRIDFPATGDSAGSPQDPALLSRWTTSLALAAEELRRIAEVDRVAAVGVGAGGLAAIRAISENAAIDELITWGVPSHGRAIVRELSAFARLEETAGGAEDGLQSPPLPSGYLWVGGFLLNAETVEELAAVDINALELPAGRLDRALMLERDGINVDQRLRSYLEQNGVTVSVGPGEGFGAMMAKPHHAKSPVSVFARVRSWLEDVAPAVVGEPSIAPRGAPAPPPEDPLTMELSIGNTVISEVPLKVRQSFGDLFGILAQPLDAPPPELCVVLLNAGAIRRIGPNRMWVEAARRWAARGVATLRLDLEGIGDADGDAERFSELAELYVPQMVDQVRAALDAVEQRGSGRRFVLAGLCSGAYWAFHAALRDDRVAAAFMLNPQALFWDPSLEAARDLRRALRSSSWRMMLRGDVPLERLTGTISHAPVALARRAIGRRSRRRQDQAELDHALDRLRDTGKQLRFMFSGNEPLYEELQRDGYIEQLDRWPNISVEFLPGRVHTLRPYAAQRRAHESLDRALDEVLQRQGGQTISLSNASR
jgi:alpha-beta hydrolase superfamily lysophospholipase